MSRTDPALSAAIALTRFGLGARPGEIDQARADPKGWLAAQIRPDGADQPGGGLPSSQDRMIALFNFNQQIREIREQAKFQRASLSTPAPAGAAAPDAAMPDDPFKAARRAYLKPIQDEVGQEMLARADLACTTPAGFRERWALFWSNHFTVGQKNEIVQALAGPFEREAIRPHVFGRFEDLLVASSTHPAMLAYLDQAQSIGPDSPAGVRRHLGLNENLAREIMELHTVGVEAGYTQADVTEFARALTGYSFGREEDRDPGAFMFRAAIHEPGERTIMRRAYAPGEFDQARKILADLAGSPFTARHIARKLAAHFVADDPPASLVRRLEGAYMSSNGDLARVAEALISAPEAWEPPERKLKTPYDFIVSSFRAADIAPTDVKQVVPALTLLGQRPFSAPSPKGWPDDAASWGAPDAIVKRLSIAEAFGARAAPPGDPAEVAKQALGARLTPATLQAVSRAETRGEAFAILLMSPEFQRR